MAAVVPGLSALLTWPTDHLTEAANHWEAVGERSYGLAHGVWSDALASDWQGEAADALRATAHSDMLTTSGVVDQLQDAAGVARSGASDLEAARSQVRYAVEDARSAGFDVSENLAVTDRTTGGSVAQRAARQAAAQAFAAQIGSRAAQLVSTDAQVAARVTAAMAGVGSTFPKTHAGNGQVHAVDNRTFKKSPGKPPSPPKGPSPSDMRKVIEKLPTGKRPGIKEVRTPEDLQDLKNWLTEHGTDMDSRYEPGKGQWKRLPDGSEVGERYAADSTGRGALEIDLKASDGTKQHWKIHINPKTGGVPEFPTAKPAPVESAPVEEAPAESLPTEPTPTEGGLAAGGPSGTPPGLHFVPAPGSINHPFPIIGEDDPLESDRNFKR